MIRLGFSVDAIIFGAIIIFLATAMFIPMESDTLRPLRPFYMAKAEILHLHVGSL
jgi:hypothetical protein